MNKLLFAMMMGAAMLLGGPQSDRPDTQLQSAINKEVVEGDLKGAIELYRKIAAQPGAGRDTVATALLRMGQCYEKLGEAQVEEARATYERVVREFGDQSGIVAQARARLSAMGGPGGVGGLVTRRILADASVVGSILSADGKLISKVDMETGDVVQFDIASGLTKRIKNVGPWSQTEQSVDDPVFSRDGKRIADNPEKLSETKEWLTLLRIRNLDGSGSRTLLTEKDYVEPLGWSPDGGNILALLIRGKVSELARISTADGSVRVLKILSDWFLLERTAISPDGSLFYRIDASFGRLFTGELDIETGKEIVSPAAVTMRFTSPPTQISWSPDGKELAYISNRGWVGPGNNILVVRSAATGEERLLTPRLRGINQISWAPDSRSIIALGAGVKSIAFFRIDAITGEIAELGGEGVAPRLCPDGKTLLYVKGGPFIVKRNLDTGAESKVVDIKGMNYAISPDGREISFIDRTDGSVKATSLDGGEPRLIFKGPAQAGGWTRDGRYFLVLAGGNRWRIPAQGGTPLKLEYSVPKMQWVALNPDNRRFFFGVNDESKSELWVMENFLPPTKAGK
jgi:Tol biopolymer transport system component